uniref:Prefoldin subunit 6 n=1 Tax=Corethron hystrix TaxID=216773 RepID=A0A6U5LUD7_9STRA|mmetsp:Transcript_712/g.1446  ORF Transcript_712/g.1446 Transcript_712/m.1446 type:complete len:147 (+) Transcript_712:130-570(+)|eukprot:CAMPEP_0113302298 /NCGR_PEP_ID=MMETSP0010_2-20120614/3165_1 /TAXON_ID=216773 ORGANISM="Corethron hystrix, Strain 308" /NCGR_SAMPLE_ID=MMETSP0010_2 /ASSEMBLY_ACC=CAM_ASM_000155 /LENGTH=146 /DNA_ID=CAMNT_0000156057 /DNA_START=49 /DNA_END=489 /DNA_ORIENTATION=+ /assembly_acc=CAM_ASM_000155
MSCSTSQTAEIDGLVSKYKILQEDLTSSRSAHQTLLQQLNENEMVESELEIVAESPIGDGAVFKLVGPVLMRNDLGDARETVQKRMEFITGEMSKAETKISKVEKHLKEIAEKIQTVQGRMQQEAVSAARKIASKQSGSAVSSATP